MSFRIIALLVLSGFNLSWAGVDLPAVIGDGMVLQRQATVPVWGWGEAGDKVSVSFAGQVVERAVQADGSWRVDLEPLTASSVEREMTITVGAETSTLKGVVVGEVWFASGQSNMQANLGESSRDAMDKVNQPVVWAIREEATRHSDPLIRQLKVPLATSYDKPLKNFEGQWTKAENKDSKNQFSSVAYYFAKELRKNLDMPVGVIVSAWGAKRIQPFIPESQYRKDPALAEYYDEYMAKMERRIEAYDPVAEEAKFEAIMAKWHERSRQAKAEGKWPPKVPKRWYPKNDPTFPGTIYNAMIHPVVPYAIRGAIWYQGESNAKHPKVNIFDYETYLRALIDGWRDSWGQGDFPVYYCQLAQFRAAPEKPVDEDFWVDVCDDMRRALSHKNVGMAVLNDCGEVRDIHPRNKIDAGKRLALWALAKDYGQPGLVYSGPLYQSHTIEGNRFTITFDSVGEGLMTAQKQLHRPAKAVEEELQGFQICGKDRQWKWAQAKITGRNTVEVWHPEVSVPDEVRYAWASNPARANLYNQAGLPTSVFSTN